MASSPGRTARNELHFVAATLFGKAPFSGDIAKAKGYPTCGPSGTPAPTRERRCPSGQMIRAVPRCRVRLNRASPVQGEVDRLRWKGCALPQWGLQYAGKEARGAASGRHCVFLFFYHGGDTIPHPLRGIVTCPVVWSFIVAIIDCFANSLRRGLRFEKKPHRGFFFLLTLYTKGPNIRRTRE